MSHSQDFDVCFFPCRFECFSCCRHEEEEEDWGHIVALTNTNALDNVTDFLVNLEDNLQINVHGLDGSDELGGAPYFSRTFSSRLWLAVL